MQINPLFLEIISKPFYVKGIKQVCISYSKEIKVVLNEGGFDEFNQKLRNSIPAGMYGNHTVNQNIIMIATDFNEPIVGVDEAGYFVGKEANRVKLISEWDE